MRTKQFEIIETKADGDQGEFTALVAVIGNVDRGGDRIVSGAFDKTIKAWQDSGDPFPIILSHQWDNPMSHIGIADPKTMREVSVKAGTKAGGRNVLRALQLTGKLDVGDNPVAAQVHRLMKRRSLKEFSIGYGVPANGEKVADDGANELLEIDLVEAGPTLKGMNPATELLAVKSAMDQVSEPKSEAELRRETVEMERDRDRARMADLKSADPVPAEPGPIEAALSAVTAELSAVSQQIAEAMKPPIDEAEQRKRLDAIERARVAEDLPPGTPVAAVPEVVSQALTALTERLGTISEKVDEVRAAADAKSERELRRESEQLQRERQKRDLPAPERPNPTAALEERLAEVTSELERVRDLAEAKSETELRRETERLERARRKRDLPEAERPNPAAEATAALEGRLVGVTEELERVRQLAEAKTERELRREAETLERARVKADLPTAAEPEPEPDPVAEQIAALANAVETLAARMDEPPAATEAELKRASELQARERIADDLPSTDDPELSPEQKMAAELESTRAEVQELRRRLDRGKAYAGKRLASDLRTQLDSAGSQRYASTGGGGRYAYVDDFDPDQGWVVYCVYSEADGSKYIQVDYTTNADGSIDLAADDTEVVRTTTYRPLNQPPKSDEPVVRRPADDLRKRSDQTVLEIQSDGASLRKYIPPAEAPHRELPSESELRRRSHAEMIALMTGVDT